MQGPHYFECRECPDYTLCDGCFRAWRIAADTPQLGGGRHAHAAEERPERDDDSRRVLRGHRLPVDRHDLQRLGSIAVLGDEPAAAVVADVMLHHRLNDVFRSLRHNRRMPVPFRCAILRSKLIAICRKQQRRQKPGTKKAPDEIVHDLIRSNLTSAAMKDWQDDQKMPKRSYGRETAYCGIIGACRSNAQSILQHSSATPN